MPVDTHSASTVT